MGQGSRATVEALVPGQGSRTTVEAPAVVVVPGQGVPGQGSRTTVEAQAVAVVVVLGGVKAGTKVAKAGLCYPKTP